MTVVAALQVNAHFLSDKQLETVHGLTSLGNVQLVVVRVAHFDFSPFSFSGKQAAFRKTSFSFRNPSLTKVGFCMNGEWRKQWK